MSFVHLHVHSHYSLLDGFGSPKDIVKKAVKDGSPAIALTDHGAMYGAIEFYQAALDAGIKPIVGCEVYVAPNSRFDKSPGVDSKRFHLTLLAKNYEGYKNLMILVSKANIEGFYYKPRVDHGLLKTYSKGLIALSGCLAGEVSHYVQMGDEKKQKEVINRYIDIFGIDDFYLEIQDNPLIDQQKVLNDRLIELSKEMNVQLVASQDSHYVNKEDSKYQDILLCIQTQSTIDQEDRMKFEGDFSLKSPAEMEAAFAHVPEALENTVKIADKVDIDIKFGLDLIPKFKTPSNENAHDYLKALCLEGLHKRYDENPSEDAKKRLEYELGIVKSMGFDDYFLIVWDFVKFARDRGITVGPGRGSAAGSLITYCLEITDLDPLKYGLIFERFLNPERISMPDVDIDFADTRRDEVLEYVREKYGRDNVAQIITFGTMAARAAVRDVGRAMGYPYADVDRIAKLIPPPVQGKHIPLTRSVKEDPELKKVYESEPAAKDLLDNAMRLEGTVRHAGTHACAVVMSEEPLVSYTPLQKSPGTGDDIITQYSMGIVEKIGLLKMDFLGLKNLTIIEGTLKILKKTKDIDLNLAKISMDDAQSYELLQRGDTTGVFQLESSGMRRYIKELVPTRFEDIIAMISLYRPGPMEWIPGYIEAQHNPDSVRYLHSSFESILKETNGVAIYQEQILQIARDFAGFSLGEADILRKAVGKKIGSLLKEQKKKFIDGAVSNSHDAKFAEEVFEKVIEPFAGYGFNKSHAACYAMISYRTAYLKSHYPVEFMAALLSADADNTDRVVLEINECEEMGISVLPPSINESHSDFTVVDDKKIRFGLSAIKGLGIGTVETFLEVRGDKKFATIEDILERVPAKLLNKKTLEALAYSGALDELGDRKSIAKSTEDMSSYAKTVQEMRAQGQVSLFGGTDAEEKPFHLKAVNSATNMEKLSWEKEYLGLYVSGHPLKGLKKYLAKKFVLIEQLSEKNIGKKVTIGGLLTTVKKVFTKAGSYMLYGEVEDPTGKIEFVVFPKIYGQFHQFFEEDKVIIMEGRLDLRRDSLQFSCLSAKSVSLEVMLENAKNDGSYDKDEKVLRRQKKIEVAKKPTVEKKGESQDNIPTDASIYNPYIIRIPNDTAPEKLNELKQLLLKNPGDRNVEIHVDGDRGARKIKVPFGIHLDEKVERIIDEFFKK